jgi:HD-like signal output (HDOD) protein
VRDLKHLPSAPRLLPRLKELLSDNNSAMHDVVALVRLDPAIAARVLQMGNSAYFGPGLRCSTVEEAVNRVGYAQVYGLVSYAVASQVLVRPLQAYGLETDELWRMSVVCALAAETLAAQTGLDRDVAYTVGLLHFLGTVAIDDWVLRKRPQLLLASRGLPHEASEAERAALGFTQAAAGAALLQHWDFPQAMCEPVGWQYDPHSCAADPQMACLLQSAKWVRTVVCANDASSPPPPLPHESVLKLLSLRPADLPKQAEKVRQRMDEVSSLLKPSGKAPGAGTDRNRFPSPQ